MKYYSDISVLDAALDRIRRIFDEFETIIVNFSGGKDSTVCLNLSLQVAREKNRLPLKVLFIDQEAEYSHAINYIKTIMYSPEIEPLWYQIPLQISNATSHTENWLQCWEEGAEWMREKDPISIKVNDFGTKTFAQLFIKIADRYGPSVAKIGGVRTEESPSRLMGLTNAFTYKDITWGRVENKSRKSYTFYPIYDWSYRDVWKYIHDGEYPYCKIYDYMYQLGVPINNMRVSSLHHETSINNLFTLQEFEPNNWNALVKRLDGINSVTHIGKENFFVKDLPYMFESWREYRDYLLSKIVVQKLRPTFKTLFDRMDPIYESIKDVCGYDKVCVQALIANDYHSVKLGNFEANTYIIAYRSWLKTGERSRKNYNKFIDYVNENNNIAQHDKQNSK